MNDTTAPRCNGRNGTYNCEMAPHSENVRHRKTFRHMGGTMVARWSESFGEVKFYRPKKG